MDDIIISAGHQLGPFEMEDALIKHDAVAEAAAVASPHAKSGDVVKAYVVLIQEYEGSDNLTEEIQDFAKSETDPYKYPCQIGDINELLKTSDGKIRLIELRQEEQEAS